MNGQIKIETLESVLQTFYVGTCSCGNRSPMYRSAASAKAAMTTHIRFWCTDGSLEGPRKAKGETP